MAGLVPGLCAHDAQPGSRQGSAGQLLLHNPLHANRRMTCTLRFSPEKQHDGLTVETIQSLWASACSSPSRPAAVVDIC
jgi:5,10-methylene-tetrahydrofolate dehydrogenase/methenyl tetrahydrofolate cyclohydrolase